MQIGKENQLSLFVLIELLDIREAQNFTKKGIETINNFSKTAGYKKQH